MQVDRQHVSRTAFIEARQLRKLAGDRLVRCERGGAIVSCRPSRTATHTDHADIAGLIVVAPLPFAPAIPACTPPQG